MTTLFLPDIICEQSLLGIHLSSAAYGGRDQGLDHLPLLGPALLNGAGQAHINVGDDMLHGGITELQGKGHVGQQPASVSLGNVMLLLDGVEKDLKSCLPGEGKREMEVSQKQEGEEEGEEEKEEEEVFWLICFMTSLRKLALISPSCLQASSD